MGKVIIGAVSLLEGFGLGRRESLGGAVGLDWEIERVGGGPRDVEEEGRGVEG